MEKVVIPPPPEKRITMAWDSRISIPVTRPGYWTGDPWVASKTDEGWVSIELEGKGGHRDPGVGSVAVVDTEVAGGEGSVRGKGDDDLMP